MEDSVSVLGTQVTCVDEAWGFLTPQGDVIERRITSHLTYVKIPETNTYILNIDRPGFPELCSCDTRSLELSLLYGARKPFVSIDLPRSVLLEYIDSVKNRPDTLDAWKATLVLEGIRKRLAARTIQRRFKRCISDPTFRMCQNRLRREFLDLVNHS